MDKRTITFSLAAFALGCALAWLAKTRITEGGHPQETTAGSVPHRAVSPSRPGAPAADQRKAATSYQNLDSKEMALFLDTIKANAGMLVRWDSEQYRLFHQALTHWFGKDPEAAIHWAMAWPNETDRVHLFQFLIGIEGEKDVVKGLALLEKLESMSGDELTAPQSMVKAAMLKDAATLLKVMEKFPGYHHATSGFAPDFDFKTAIEGMIGIHEKDEKKSLHVSNIVSEWTKRDPQAALDWLRASESTPPGAWAQFARGYVEVGGLNELGGLAADLARNSQGDYKQTWSLLTGEDKVPAVESFLSAAGDDAAAHATGLFVESFKSSDGNWISPSDNASRDLLLGHIPPADRLALMTESYRDSTSMSTVGYLGKKISETMKELGHSEAEIEAALSANPRSKSRSYTEISPLPPR